MTFAELADEMCPVFMSMGMSYGDYWYGDYTQLQYYRKAFELQRERMNYDAWLQGAYVYDALCMVSPVLHAFAKKGTTPTPYHKEPYGVQKPIDPEIAKAKFLSKWQSNKAKWRTANNI